MNFLSYLKICIFYFAILGQLSCAQQDPQKAASELSYPDHHAEQDSTGDLPQYEGYVNDYEGLFTSEQAAFLETLIADFDRRTTIQIALATIDTSMTSAEEFDIYTLRLARFWGPGEKDKNNGVLVGISAGYQIMRIQNGLAVEKILSNEETGQIVDTAFFPHYRRGDFYQGTLAGLEALMKILEERSK